MYYRSPVSELIICTITYMLNNLLFSTLTLYMKSNKQFFIFIHICDMHAHYRKKVPFRKLYFGLGKADQYLIWVIVLYFLFYSRWLSQYFTIHATVTFYNVNNDFFNIKLMKSEHYALNHIMLLIYDNCVRILSDY